MSSTRVILVRHGESTATVDQVVRGAASCSGLSPLGRLQATALASRIERDREPVVDALLSSTLPRAIETAEVLSSALGGLPVQTDVELEEHRVGDADGMRFDDIYDTFGRIDHRRAPFTPLAPGAESFLEFHYRVGRALYRVIEANEGSTMLISCHGGVIDVAFRLLLDLPRSGSFDLWTLNTSITEFVRTAGDDGPGRWRLIRYNDHAHLAGLPESTNAS